MTPYTDEEREIADEKLAIYLEAQSARFTDKDMESDEIAACIANDLQCALTRAEAELAMMKAVLTTPEVYYGVVAEEVSLELERLRKRESEAKCIIENAGFPQRDARVWVEDARKWLSATATEPEAGR